MEIRVDHLQESPLTLTFAEPLANLPLLTEWVAAGGTGFDGPLSGELLVRRAGNVIEVEGTLTCAVGLACSRCLQPVMQRLVVPVALSFERQATVAAEEEAERELSEEDLGLIPFAGDVLDLREALEQEVLLGIPQHPLCRDDCAGLCLVCGGDRNRQACDCTPPVFHGGFTALKSLKLDH
jgi:uncharacterized protein